LDREHFSYNIPDAVTAVAVVVGSIDDGDYVDFEEAYNGTYIESLIFLAAVGAYRWRRALKLKTMIARRKKKKLSLELQHYLMKMLVVELKGLSLKNMTKNKALVVVVGEKWEVDSFGDMMKSWMNLAAAAAEGVLRRQRFFAVDSPTSKTVDPLELLH
jgi:hypothetical protein